MPPLTHNDSIMKNIVLHQNYAIKGDKERQFLCDVKTGKRYLLNKDQYDIMQNCNGAMTEEGLVQKVGLPGGKVKNFIHKLDKEGVLEWQEHNKTRLIIHLSREKQLREVHWEITNIRFVFGFSNSCYFSN